MRGLRRKAPRKARELNILVAAALTAAFAILAYLLKMVGRGGAIGGFVLGTIILYCAGLPGFALLSLFVVGGSALTRLGYETKKSSGVAQEGGGRRGAKNALANCAVAVVLSILYAATGAEVFIAVFVASLGAAFADTVESEIGQLYGGNPRLITSLRVVRPGTDGAVTFVGAIAGVVAASVMSLAGLALGLLDGLDAAVIVALAAFLGTIADSLIGAVAPRIGNEATNLVCTLVAAIIALALL